MNIAWLAPLFVIFEITQLLVAQHYIGYVQIRQGLHPLEIQSKAPLALSMAWVIGLLSDYAYQIVLLFQDNVARLAALLLIFVSVSGFGLRRACGLKWGMVVLTFEGAMRAGFLGFVFVYLVIHPHWMRWIGTGRWMH